MGKTLDAASGYPHYSTRPRRYMLDRVMAVGFLLAAVVTSFVGVASGTDVPNGHGVVADPDMTAVSYVLPGSPAWNVGVRPGDRIVDFRPDDRRAGYEISFATQAGHAKVSAATVTSHTRDVLPLAWAGLILAGVSGLLLLWAPVVSAATAAVATVLGGLPAAGLADPLLSDSVAILAVVAPLGWLAIFGTRRALWRWSAVVLASVVTGAWLLGRHVTWEAYLVSDSVRATATWAALMAVVGLGLVLPAWRTRVAGPVEQLFREDAPGGASLAALEEERGRLARELHDSPIQDLAAVIRSLDAQPATEPEAELLRKVAADLRQVTTDLRPPELEDLGLGAALDQLCGRSGSLPGAIRVVASIEDGSLEATTVRPPPPVELACYRIAQEALANAQAHSRARRIELRGRVGTGTVELDVEDDGVGIDPGARQAARRAGRQGMGSMHGRAEAVGGRLRIEAALPHGTRVTFRWSAPGRHR